MSHFAVLALLAGGMVSRAPAQLTLINWSGVGDWSSSTRWGLLSPLLPTLLNSAGISSGAVTVSDARSIGGIAFTGGVITGGGTLTLTSVFGSTWSGGTFSGSGTTAINSDSKLTIGGIVSLEGRTLANSGTLTWNSGIINTSQGAVLQNLAGANFTINSDSTFNFTGTGTRPTISNAGTISKAGGTGTAEIAVSLNNSGTVQVRSGTLSLTGGGTNTGTLSALGSGNVIYFNGDYTLATGSVLNGDGQHQLLAGTLTATGNIAAANLTLRGGTLAGVHAITGALTWNDGILGAGGTTTISAGSTLNVNTSVLHDFSDHALIIDGTLQWTGGGGNLYAGNGGTITIGSGGTFTILADSTLYGSGVAGATAALTNHGSLHKNSSGTSVIALPVHHNGSVLVSGGTLLLTGGGSISGTATTSVDPGAKLEFGSGTFSLASGATLTGSGEIKLTGATLNVPMGVATLENLQFSSGTLSGTGQATITGLAQTGGTLSLAALQLTGASSLWSAGSWGSTTASTATIAKSATLALSGSTGVLDFDGRTITNLGTVNWNSGYLAAGVTGSFINAAGAVFSDSADASFYANGTSTASFSNAGEYNKRGDGISSFSTPFHNTGTLNLLAGTLQLANGGTSTGTFSANGGTVLQLGGTHAFNGASFLGGTVEVNAGSATFSGASTANTAAFRMTGGNITIGTPASAGNTFATSGAFDLTTGTLTVGGTLTTSGLLTWTGGAIAGGGTINTTGGLTLATHATLGGGITLNLGGTTNWTSGSLYGSSGASVINNTAGGTFNASFNYGYIDHTSGDATATLVFNNAGRFVKSDGFTYLGVTFNNTGSVDVQSGTLQLAGGGTHSGTVALGSGAVLDLAGGDHTLNPSSLATGAIITGKGTLGISGGTVTLSGTSTGNTAGLAISGGNARFTGTLSSTGALSISGGLVELGGTTSFDSASSLSGGELKGTGTLNLGRGIELSGYPMISGPVTLNLTGGTSTWTSGQLYTSGSPILNLAGGATFTTNFDGAWYDNTGGGDGTVLTFNNAGTFIKSAASTGEGYTRLQVVFNNTGSVELQAGTLKLDRGGTSTGAFNLAAGTTLQLDGGTHNFNAGTTLPGAGSVVLSYGTLNIGGNLTSGGAITVEDGMLGGAGSLTVPQLTLSGGSISVASLAITGTGSIWSGGTMEGSGSTTVRSGAALALTNVHLHHLDGRALINEGTLNWTAGDLKGLGAASLLNASGGLIVESTDGRWLTREEGSTFVFTNRGTYRHTGAGSSAIVVPLTNEGTIEVLGGELLISGGGLMTAGGTITTSSGATVTFDENFTIASGGTLVGKGTFKLTDGTLDIAGAIDAATFTQTGGTLAGSPTLKGTFAWNGGGWDATALGSTTTISSVGTLNLGNHAMHSFDRRAIVNEGTVNWASGYLHAGNGATFTNAAGATFNDFNAGGYSIKNHLGGTFVFNNAGTYVRDAAGTTYFETTFNNTGTLSLVRGRIELNGGGSFGATSVVNIGDDTAFRIASDFTLTHGAQFTGLGSVTQTAGTLTANGTLKAASFLWNGGTWDSPSAAMTTIDGTTLLYLGNFADHSFNRRTFVNEGVTTWLSGNLKSGNGGAFTNAANGLFLDSNESNYAIGNPYGGTFTFTNLGSYVRDTTGTTYADVTFNNSGYIRLEQGSLLLQGGGTMSSTSDVTVAAGAALTFAHDYTISNGAAFAGAGTVEQTGGTLAINGTLKAPLFQWNGGNWNSTTAATTTIDAATTLLLASASDHAFDRRTIFNQGTINWDGGYLYSGNGGLLKNAPGGVFNDRNGYGYSVDNSFGGTFTFDNQGTYNRTTAGTTTFNVGFDNSGTINLQAGSLLLQGGGTFGATSVVNAASGSTVTFKSNYTVADGAQFLGAGTFRQTGGTFDAAVLRASNFTWTAGDWNATVSNAATSIFAGTTLNLSGGGAKDFVRRAIENHGIVNWYQGDVRGASGSTFLNAADGVFNDYNTLGYTLSFASGTSGFTFTNAGLYTKSSGTTTVTVPFVNTGTIAMTGGTLRFQNTFTNTGALALSGGATVHFADTLQFTTAPLSGTGTIVAPLVIAGGQVSPGNSPGTLTFTGNLTLLATSTLIIELGGPVQGTGFDFLDVGGVAVVAGTLQLKFLNGYNASVLATDTFTILNSAGLTGTFLNVPNGGRVDVAFGQGSFQVNYGLGSSFAANSVVLSNFSPIPEPSTYALMGLGALVVIYSIRRRKS